MSKTDDLVRKFGASLAQTPLTRSRPEGMPSVASIAPLEENWRVGLDRSKSAWMIPLDKIIALDQPREEFDDDRIELLAESMRRDGLLHPITTLYVPDLGKHRIVTGERRYRAALLLGWKSIACTILEKPLAPDELLALQCVENLMREDLKPIEEAKAFRTLLTVNGWSITRVAAELGLSQSRVSQSLRLLSLSPENQSNVEEGKLTPVAGYHIAKIEDPGLQAEVAARVMAEGLTRDETVAVVDQVKSSKASKASAGKPAKGRGAKAKPKPITSRVFKTEPGIRITAERAKGIEPSSLLAALEEAAAKVRAELVDDQAAA